MNGEPLGADHGAPFRLIVPHWYAVASVKWLKRIDVLTEPYAGEFQTGHYIYEWPDRPHEAVSLMRVRARITDPAYGATLSRGTHTVRGKAWSGTGPVTQVEISLTGEGDWHAAQLEPPKGPYQWQDWSFEWEANDVGTAHPPRQGDRRGRQRATRGPALEPARLRKQRHRGLLRRRELTSRLRTLTRHGAGGITRRAANHVPTSQGGRPMVLAADYPFLDVFWTMILFFCWVAWIWMLIMIFSDVFRRDISGWAKAGWCAFVLVLPFLGAFIYLIANGKGLTDRRVRDAQVSQANFDEYVRTVAADGGSAGEIERAKELLDSGAINQAEFEQLKAKALA